MVPQKHTDDLAKVLPDLDLVQGYLVRKDADPDQPLQVRAQNALPGITYASMRVSVLPLDASSSGRPTAGSKPADSNTDDSSDSGGSSGGSKKGSGKGGSGKSGSSGKKGS
jgi:uncharacterized membrane protein YgcG